MEDERKVFLFDNMIQYTMYIEGRGLSDAIRMDAMRSERTFTEWKEQMWETSPYMMRVLNDLFPSCHLYLHEQNEKQDEQAKESEEKVE